MIIIWYEVSESTFSQSWPRWDILELKHYKKDSIQSKKIPVLKLPRFFPRRKGDEKEQQF